MKIHKSLRFELTLWYAAIIAAALAAAGAFFYRNYQRGRLEELDRLLRGMALEMLDVYWKTENMPWPAVIRKAESDYRMHDPMILVVRFPGPRDRDRTFPAEVFRSSNAGAEGLLLESRAYWEAFPAYERGNPFRDLALPSSPRAPLRAVLMPTRGYVLQIALSTARLREEMGRFLAVMLLAGGVVLVLTVAGGNLIVQRALGPVKAVTRAARRITAEDLSLRIVAQHPQDEIGELVATFNDMIARLERSVDRIRQFSADVSHELRTPLAVVRSEIEVQLRRARSAEEYGAALASVLEEIAKLERIIDDLLLLSRVEALGRKGLCAAASLDEAVMAAFESREPLARNKGIAYTLEKLEPASVPGDEGLLERLAANIIDNAVRYTPGGGQVAIALQREGDAAVLRVTDTGPGIPEEALPRIFDRFVVVDRSRSRETGGAGLGLSIAKSIADVHGAAIEVRRRPGGGTEFIVRFRTGDASVPPPSASP